MSFYVIQGEKMELDEVKSSKDVFQFMLDDIEYGWIDINGDKHIKTMKEFFDVPVGISFKEFNK